MYIGNPEDVEFHPKLELGRWGSECFLKLSFDDTKVKKKHCKHENGRIKWETDLPFDFHFYPVKTETIVI